MTDWQKEFWQIEEAHQKLSQERDELWLQLHEGEQTDDE